jgi:alpha-beta hydrolase superfamily lysophospholipase
MEMLEQYFLCGNDRCCADLYLPDGVSAPPVLVMAHGFAGERTFRLPAFAEAFCRQGMAVFLFDYRTFGDSEGSPRQLVDSNQQLADWRAAIAHVRALSSLRGSKLALWGTSFSGGHVVSMAAEDSAIDAIIAQVPFVTGWNLMKGQSLGNLVQLTSAAIMDGIAAVLGLKPVLYPVVAKPGSRAIMNTAESYDGYLQLAPPQTNWKNAVPARIGLHIPFYSPLSRAPHVQCPSLIIAAHNDSLIPVAAVKMLADKIPGADYRELDTDHFQPYVEPAFADNLAIQQDFLAKHILG